MPRPNQPNRLSLPGGPMAPWLPVLARMEARCLPAIVALPGTFLQAGDRLVVGLRYRPGGRVVDVAGQDFRLAIDRASTLEALLVFTDPDRVRTFLSRLTAPEA